jgi:tRNA uridine 5-carboxymethylaminomethyl modification enzyme
LDVQYHGQTVIVTTGTFLKGLIHIGQNQESGGRAGESAALGLSASLVEAGLELGRLKTGTPPRLLRRSIDFSRTEVQPGDDPIPYFTHWLDDLFPVLTPSGVPHRVNTGANQLSTPMPYYLYNRCHSPDHPRQLAQIAVVLRDNPRYWAPVLPVH